jgi:hypothetical protein
MTVKTLWILFAFIIGIPTAPALAQSTRQEKIAKDQAEKATQLHPYVPSRAEEYFTRVTRGLVETPSGLYPSFGSVYSGGGFTLGGGYRRFYGDRATWNLQGLMSIRAYKLIELSISSPGHAQGRIAWDARIGWRDATQVAFYGLGMDTLGTDRTSFRMKQTYVSAGVEARPRPWSVFSASLAVEDFAIASGRGAAPSIDARHNAASAPGLGSDPAFLHGTVSAGIDWRPSPGYARRGGLYEVGYHNYAARDGVHDFGRVDAEIVQHIPIRRENWVVSLRGRVQTTLDGDGLVPFFLLPSLGSGSTLRGYSSWRFRDRHSLLTSVEWRWIPNRLALDMALFYDAGKVTPDRGDLNLKDLKSNVGVGVRFHGPAVTPLRIELARGSEGLHLVFAGSAGF